MPVSNFHFPRAARLSVLLILGGLGSAGAAENADLVEGIRDLFICRHLPEPTALLTVLAQEDRINVDEGVGADSEQCWAVSPPLEIEGLSFSHVCASYPDPLHIKAFPKFYWRGPGTSPGIGVRLGTSASESDLASWATKFLGDDNRATVQDAFLMENSSEISCNEYDVLSPRD